jgi:3-hydroxyanthranilic acid dioxygenase
MQPLIAFNLWQWIKEHRRDVEPLVGNQMIWKGSQFTVTIACCPHA